MAEAVRRIRLTRAATALRRETAPVAEVGRAHGYPNAGSFSRAFRVAFGVTPTTFRTACADVALHRYLGSRTEDGSLYPVTLADLPDRRVIGIAHTGPYPRIGRAFRRLYSELRDAGLLGQARALIAIYQSDPGVVAPAELRGMAAVEVAADLLVPSVFAMLVLDGGRYAIMRVTGPYTGLARAYDWLFGTWIAQSGEVPREAPCFEVYVNSPVDTAPEGLFTDIYLPLAPTVA